MGDMNTFWDHWECGNTKHLKLFFLYVDNFGVKHFSKEDVQYLHDTLAKEYTCKIDRIGENFIDYTINWNYDRGFVNISMPNYIKSALKRLLYKVCITPQYSHHEYLRVNWTKKEDR